MKARTVLLTLEVKTDAPLSVLRKAASYKSNMDAARGLHVRG